MRLSFSLGLLISFAASAQMPSPARLDLATALQRFHAHGFDLVIADAQVAAARGDLTAAGEVANPGLSIGFGKSFGCDNGCSWIPTPAWSVSLNDSGALLDTVIGKRRLRTAVAQAAYRASIQQRADAERILREQVEDQFAQVVLTQSLEQLAVEAQTSAHSTEQLTEIRYKAGAIAETDVARARTDALEADQGVEQARADLASARIGLAFLIGERGPMTQFEADASTLPSPASSSRALSDDALVQQAWTQRPDVVGLESQLTSAEKSAALARRERMSDLALTLGYSQQGTRVDAITPPTVSFGISGTLPIFNQHSGEIAHADAQRQATQAQLERARAQVASDVAAALTSYRAAQAQLQRMEGGLLDQARRAQELVQVQYAKGAASLLELLDAQRTYRQTAIEHAQELNRFWTAAFRLEAALGEKR